MRRRSPDGAAITDAARPSARTIWPLATSRLRKAAADPDDLSQRVHEHLAEAAAAAEASALTGPVGIPRSADSLEMDCSRAGSDDAGMEGRRGLGPLLEVRVIP
jgi:hypothetical protein